VLFREHAADPLNVTAHNQLTPWGALSYCKNRVRTEWMVVVPQFPTGEYKGGHMHNTYTAITKQDGNWWIGWIEEVPGVNCQEKTRDELLETLRITLKEALELNREEALRAAERDYVEEQITI